MVRNRCTYNVGIIEHVCSNPVWQVPSDVQALFSLEPLVSSSKQTLNPEFHALLKTLHAFVTSPDGPGSLPLTSTLPDMKTDTESYVKLQKLYKSWSSVEAVSQTYVIPALSLSSQSCVRQILYRRSSRNSLHRNTQISLLTREWSIRLSNMLIRSRF